MKTGIAYDDLFLEHDTGYGHPECPERLTAIMEHLKAAELLAELEHIQPVPAPVESITAVHDPNYVTEVKERCLSNPGYLHSMDTVISAASYKAACTAAGAMLQAVDAVMEKKIRNAFCAVRPPGHHAISNTALGFCLFNNVAIAARHIQSKHKLERVLIVDWDVHHGNGTQDAFYDDPTVFYFSIHRYPFYPGTGAESEKGTGKGVGTTLNVPLPGGSGDVEFVRAAQDKLKPAADAFKPDFVLVSSGFDAHEHDPLGGMGVTVECFGELTRIVKTIAEEHCSGRLASVLEGGYGLDGLAKCAERHLRALQE